MRITYPYIPYIYLYVQESLGIHFFQLSNEAIVEINFWKLNCMFLPFKTILKEYVLPERIIYTDASDHAGAGYCLQFLGKIVHSW